MPGLVKSGISLLDTTNKHGIDAWAVFTDRGQWDARTWLCRWLKPGFKHVEVWKYIPPGAWLRFSTCIESIQPEVYAHPPWVILADQNPTVVRIQRWVPRGFFRVPFFVGPITCVQLTAAFLGVRLSFMCRTPYQLFKFLTKEFAT